MRLIDADKLINALNLCGCYKYRNPKAYDTLMLYEILGAIEDQPTAYDVDKVIGELEFNSYSKYRSTYDNPYTGGSVIDEDDAIEIVKRGGVDDK